MQTFNQLLLTYETKDRTIKVDLGHGKIVDARLSVTSKGNGGLKLLNLYLRAVDIHDNGRYYEHSLLNVCLDDINGDNHKDIILYGTTLHTGEKEQDPVSKEEVLFIYTYQVTTGKFTETLRNSSFNINTN
ncbi:MAG: hypothetical protein MJK04_29660 [Psychrosphaera sp.]|nr:hypothetical protein [Psychrosphaera sp.]